MHFPCLGDCTSSQENSDKEDVYFYSECLDSTTQPCYTTLLEMSTHDPFLLPIQQCTLLHFYPLSPSDGTLNGAPCQGQQRHWHAKDVSLNFDEE